MMRRIKLFIAFFLLITISAFSQNKKYIPYTVQEGETLQSVSQKFSITPYDLLKLNPELAENSTLENGKILIVPNKDFKVDATNNDGKDYVENGFLVHTVLPKETFWKLKKEYGVAKRILRKHNPMLRVEDLKVGQVIKIPVGDEFKIAGEEAQINKTKPYLVKPKEAKYGIARRYGITVEKLDELNPLTKGRGLKLAEIIVVPDTAEIPDAEEGFTNHQIEKGETFFSLGQHFNITKEDLITANPELNEGVKEGMVIRIPIVDEFSTNAFVPQIIPGKELKAVLMLPFMSNKSNVDFEKSKTSDIATDFYLGALMALDSLKQQGLSVKMKVLDTQNNKTVVSGLIASGNFSDTDVVIGPMFLSNVEFVSSALKNKDIPIISPVSQKDHKAFSGTKLIQDMPSDEKMMQKVLEYMKANYNGENIVIFSDTTKAIMPKLIRTARALEPLDSLTTIEIIKPKKGYFRPELFREKITDKKDNWVILVSNDPIVTTDVVQNLGVLPKKTKATFFALNKGSNFRGVDNTHLGRVNFHYPSSSYVDLEDRNVQKFIRKYKMKNYAVPSEYAFKGFDITYDALLRFASYEDTETALKAGFSERTATKFDFDTNGYGKGFSNKGVYLIKYDGLNLVKIEDDKPIVAIEE